MSKTKDLKEILHLNALEAAPLLLGAMLIKGNCKAKIVEIEAYRGTDDLGSHACRGITARTKIMFGSPGFAYVYFTYGMYWMLNVVCEQAGQPAALLIRAAKPLKGIEEMFKRRPKAKTETDLLSGPAKLALAMQINGAHNGMDLLNDNSELHLEAGSAAKNVIIGNRIGLSIGKGEHLPWRFIDSESIEWVSKPHPNIIKDLI